MLHVLPFILSLNTGRAHVAAHHPVVGAQCYQSRDVYALGTGNIPGGSGRATSVVNIWVYRSSSAASPFAWIYKNFAGQYWIQANSLKYEDKIQRAFPHWIAKQLLHGSTAWEMPIPSRMDTLSAYDRYFKNLGASRSDCFTGDLPSNYL